MANYGAGIREVFAHGIYRCHKCKRAIIWGMEHENFHMVETGGNWKGRECKKCDEQWYETGSTTPMNNLGKLRIANQANEPKQHPLATVWAEDEAIGRLIWEVEGPAVTKFQQLLTHQKDAKHQSVLYEVDYLLIATAKAVAKSAGNKAVAEKLSKVVRLLDEINEE